MTRYGLFLQNKRKNFDAAEALFESAIHCDPTNLDALQSYSVFLDEIRQNRVRAEYIYSLAVNAVERQKCGSSREAGPELGSSKSKRKVVEEKFQKLQGATRAHKSPTIRTRRKSCANSVSARGQGSDEQALSESESLARSDSDMRPRAGVQRVVSSDDGAPEASRRAASKKIDADVRFTCGQVVMDEGLGPRHAKYHFSSLHPKPWVGALDKAGPAPRPGQPCEACDAQPRDAPRTRAAPARPTRRTMKSMQAVAAATALL